MAHHLGCDLSSRFAAIASMEGALWGRSCRPTQPVSVLQIHGTADTVVPYPGMVRELLDGCKGPPLREVAGIVVKDTYTNCQAGATLALYSVQGLDHNIASPQQFNEAQAIWRFFANHPKLASS